MFEFHIWLVIRSSPGDADPGDELESVERATVLLQELADGPELVDLRNINGQIQLSIGGFTNRPSPHTDKFLDLLSDISRKDTGTYGIAYIHDDESPNGANEFRVLVVSRGRVVERSDPFLSPVVPVLEDG